MSQVISRTSPFNCQWIEKGSEGRMGLLMYAMCTRIRSGLRVVSEEECAECPFWREPRDIQVCRVCETLGPFAAACLISLRARRSCSSR
jgi:hypothetical protein